MNPSTSSHSDSDCSTASWILVNGTTAEEARASGVQDVRQHDSVAAGSDIESDTDGVSIISESEVDESKLDIKRSIATPEIATEEKGQVCTYDNVKYSNRKLLDRIFKPAYVMSAGLLFMTILLSSSKFAGKFFCEECTACVQTERRGFDLPKLVNITLKCFKKAQTENDLLKCVEERYITVGEPVPESQRYQFKNTDMLFRDNKKDQILTSDVFEKRVHDKNDVKVKSKLPEDYKNRVEVDDHGKHAKVKSKYKPFSEGNKEQSLGYAKNKAPPNASNKFKTLSREKSEKTFEPSKYDKNNIPKVKSKFKPKEESKRQEMLNTKSAVKKVYATWKKLKKRYVEIKQEIIHKGLRKFLNKEQKYFNKWLHHMVNDKSSPFTRYSDKVKEHKRALQIISKELMNLLNSHEKYLNDWVEDRRKMEKRFGVPKTKADSNKKKGNGRTGEWYLKKRGNGTTGEWYSNMFTERNKMRKKEHSSDWVFDRATMRNGRREKAQWYSHKMERQNMRYANNF